MGSGRQQAYAPHRFSLYLENSSQAFRDGYSLSASAQEEERSAKVAQDAPADSDDFSCPASLLPSTESWPEDEWNCYAPRDVEAGRPEYTQRDTSLPGRVKDARNTTSEVSHNAHGCEPKKSMGNLAPDDNTLERIVSLIQVAQDTPHLNSSCASKKPICQQPAPGQPTQEGRLDKASRLQAACDSQGPRDALRRPGVAGCSVQEEPRCATGAERAPRALSPSESDWSAEVLLRHAAGDRFKLYTELANMPSGTSSTEEEEVTGAAAAAERGVDMQDSGGARKKMRVGAPYEDGNEAQLYEDSYGLPSVDEVYRMMKVCIWDWCVVNDQGPVAIDKLTRQSRC